MPRWSKFDVRNKSIQVAAASAQPRFPLLAPSAGNIGHSQLLAAPFSRDLPLAMVAASTHLHHPRVATANDQKVGGTTDLLSFFKEGHLYGTIFASDSPLPLPF